MSPKLYKLYKAITIIKRRVRRKVSKTGRLMIFFAALSLLFGMNTTQTMIYQLAVLSVSLVICAFPLSFFFKTVLNVRRILPETCTAGEKFSYSLLLENNTHNKISGQFFTESSGSKLPTFEEFESTDEEGEGDRNFFDRKFGYYRWLWLLNRSVGSRLGAFELPTLEGGEKRRVEVGFTPLRRGYIHLSGFSIYGLEPLGLFKKEKFFHAPDKILVLPKMYPVVRASLAGSRRYHQGGVSGATSSGNTGEFVSLREYRPGDQVKHIDWKATARSNKAIVRQYRDEYFSRYGIMLDTFAAPEGGDVFENAVSIAASIVVRQDRSNNLIDLLFAGDQCISSLSTGCGQSSQSTMLEVLACITDCRTRFFSELAETVIAHTTVLSGLILVLLTLDDERKELVTYLKNSKVPHRIILVTSNKRESERVAESMHLPEIVMFDVNEETKVVNMA